MSLSKKKLLETSDLEFQVTPFSWAWASVLGQGAYIRGGRKREEGGKEGGKKEGKEEGMKQQGGEACHIGEDPPWPRDDPKSLK